MAIRHYNAALLLQRYTKGYLVAKVWQEKLHRAIVDRITAEFRATRARLQLDAQIKIRFAWRVYKQRKRIKKEKKKAAAAAKAAKKKGARRRAPAATAPAPALSTSNYQQKDEIKNQSSVKQTSDGIVDLQITQNKEEDSPPKEENKDEEGEEEDKGDDEDISRDPNAAIDPEDPAEVSILDMDAAQLETPT